MAPRATLGTFGVPSPRGCIAPSALAAELARLARVAAILGGALLVSAGVTAGLAHLAARRADVVPYVADGGVFGCEVRVLPGPSARVPAGSR